MSANQASKPLTPAQTAKPLGSSAKTATTKKADMPVAENVTAIAKDDASKAIEKLETRTKAV